MNVETVGVETSDTGLCAQTHPPISGSLMLCSCHLEILNNSNFYVYFVGEVCFLQQENGAIAEWHGASGSCVVLSRQLLLSSQQGLYHILSVPY